MPLSTSSYEDLIAILEREFTLCSELVNLLQKEKDVIAGVDLEALDVHVREKELVAAKISICEEGRERLLQSLGIQGRTLSEIAGTAGPEHSGRLALISSKFKAITHSIAELNKLNGLLIDRSLFYIRSSSRFLDSLGIKASGKISVEA
jgi:flagellar biosynthesis/type III secretory pathway chaperone